MGRLGGVNVRYWLKTKAGIASLVSFIIAPAGVMAVSSQANDDETPISVQPSASTSKAASHSSNLTTDGSNSTEVNQQSSNATAQATVTVDDQIIEVPSNGSMHKVIETEGGTMTIDVTTQNTASGDNKTKSRHTYRISSKSKSEVESNRNYHESIN